MAELKPCPFCGGVGEMHTRWNTYEESVEHKNQIPTGAKFAYMKEYEDCRRYYYRRKMYIPRCTSTDCVGRTTRTFWDKEKAAEEWNRRADNG